MPKQISSDELDSILQAVAAFPGGGSIEDISRGVRPALPKRTLQRRMALLVEQNLALLEGEGRASRYRLSLRVSETPAQGSPRVGHLSVSPEGGGDPNFGPLCHS